MSVMTRALSASQGIYHVYLFSTLDLQHLASCPKQNKYLRTTDGIHELHSYYPPPFSPFSFPPRWVRWTVMTFVLSLGTEMSPSWCPCPGSSSASSGWIEFHPFLHHGPPHLCVLWVPFGQFVSFSFITHFFVCFPAGILLAVLSACSKFCLSYGRMAKIRPGQTYGWVSSSITK